VTALFLKMEESLAGNSTSTNNFIESDFDFDDLGFWKGKNNIKI
jgi:hypothetical protein